MAVTVNFTTIPCEPNTANRHKEWHFLAKSIPALTTLCMLGLKFLKSVILFFYIYFFPLFSYAKNYG